MTGGDKQQSRVESSTRMQTRKQNQPQKPKTMALKLPNGQRAKTDKENMSVFRPHCIRILNNHRIVLPEALEFIKKQETYLTRWDS
jgi:hypothetical protein